MKRFQQTHMHPATSLLQVIRVTVTSIHFTQLNLNIYREYSKWMILLPVSAWKVLGVTQYNVPNVNNGYMLDAAVSRVNSPKSKISSAIWEQLIWGCPAVLLPWWHVERRRWGWSKLGHSHKVCLEEFSWVASHPIFTYLLPEKERLLLPSMCETSATVWNTWPVKEEDLVRLHRTEMSMLCWMSHATFKDRIPSKDLLTRFDLLPVRPVTLVRPCCENG